MVPSIKTPPKILIVYFLLVSVFCLNNLSCAAKIEKDNEFQTLWNFMEAKIPKWIEYSRKIDPEFEFGNFYLEWSGTLRPIIEYTSSRSRHNRLDSIYYYLYSPDSTKSLDIYSVNAHLDTVKGSIEAMFQGDVGALLFDLKKSKMSVLISCGTTCCLDEAAWIDNNSFIVTGYSESIHSAPFPCSAFVEYINLKENTRKVFRSTRYLTRLSGYYGYKFPEFAD